MTINNHEGDFPAAAGNLSAWLFFLKKGVECNWF